MLVTQEWIGQGGGEARGCDRVPMPVGQALSALEHFGLKVQELAACVAHLTAVVASEGDEFVARHDFQVSISKLLSAVGTCVLGIGRGHAP